MDAEGTAQPERLIEALLESGVLGTEGPDELRITESFSERLDGWTSTIEEMDEPDLRGELTSFATDEEVDALIDRCADCPTVLSEYLALGGVDQLSHADRLRAVTVFDSFRYDGPPESGAPDAFLPVRGERLPIIFDVYEKTIVYIWLEDCEPCDITCGDFDDILTERPDNIGLFAVYGPECSSLLQERYDVTGGPVTLFTLDGEIDVRLEGPKYRQVIETEIEKLRNL